MKKRVIVIAIVVLLALIAAVATVICLQNRPSANHTDVLNCQSEVDVKAYIENHNLDHYAFEKDYAYMADVSVLQHNAEAEFLFDEQKNVEKIRTHFLLFQPSVDIEEISESQNEAVYSFTQEDRQVIAQSFDKVKAAFEEKIGAQLTQYDIVPTQMDISVEDTDEMFYQGLFIKEYSVRDADGYLWLLRYEAGYGIAGATLIKVVDEQEYAGFIPALDLTK